MVLVHVISSLQKVFHLTNSGSKPNPVSRRTVFEFVDIVPSSFEPSRNTFGCLVAWTNEIMNLLVRQILAIR